MVTIVVLSWSGSTADPFWNQITPGMGNPMPRHISTMEPSKLVTFISSGLSVSIGATAGAWGDRGREEVGQGEKGGRARGRVKGEKGREGGRYEHAEGEREGGDGAGREREVEQERESRG